MSRKELIRRLIRSEQEIDPNSNINPQSYHSFSDRQLRQRRDEVNDRHADNISEQRKNMRKRRE